MFESGSEWPQKLQPALLAANTCWKRSTGYTPFYLMYGRNANAVHLFKYHGLDFHNDSQAENDSLDTMIVDTTPHGSPNGSAECLESIDEERVKSREQAQNNILLEQLSQKGIFDKKVTKNRYVLIENSYYVIYSLKSKS